MPLPAKYVCARTCLFLLQQGFALANVCVFSISLVTSNRTQKLCILYHSTNGQHAGAGMLNFSLIVTRGLRRIAM